MNKSIRAQLLIGTAAITVAALVVANLAIFVILRASLLRGFDDSLGSKARALATLVEQEGNQLEVKFASHPLHEFARKLNPEYYQLWDEQGRSIFRSRHLIQSDLKLDSGSPVAPGFRHVLLPDQRPGRQAAVKFYPSVQRTDLDHERVEDDDDDDEISKELVDFSGRRQMTLVVARGTAEVDQTISQLWWLLVAISTAVVSTTLLAVAFVVSRSLKPLRILASQISLLDEAALTERFSLQAMPTELCPVVDRLNEMLGRLDMAIQRERVFSSDVAHELRTPLSGLRSTIEVTLTRDRESAEYRRSLITCEEICKETQKLVEALLSLARAEARAIPLVTSPIQIPSLIDKSWSPLASKASGRGVTVCFHGSASAIIQGDESQLYLVLTNLLANAVEYVEKGGFIDIGWTLTDSQLQIEVANSGCELTDNELPNVFERFWRADSARAATGTHAGLGLPLCQKIMEALGGSINVRRVDDRFIVVVGIPSVVEVQGKVDEALSDAAQFNERNASTECSA